MGWCFIKKHALSQLTDWFAYPGKKCEYWILKSSFQIFFFPFVSAEMCVVSNKYKKVRFDKTYKWKSKESISNLVSG